MNPERKAAVFLFTGQGSQYYGMGRRLYRSEPCFRQVMDELDRIAEKQLSLSVLEIVFSASKDMIFDRTLYTHPGLFMVQYALGICLVRQGLTPSLVLGASLGEYLALAISGALDPEAVLVSLINHARAVETRCRPGGMMGVMADPLLHDQMAELKENTSLACVSSPFHFVISGEKGGVEKAGAFLASQGIAATPLPVRFGFHSPNIDPAQGLWEKQLPLGETPGKPEIKTISCLTGRAVEAVTMEDLTRIPRDPILFARAASEMAGEIRQLEERGKNVALVDLGPGGFTSALMRHQGILGKSVRVFRVMTPFGDEMRHLNKLKQEMGLS